MRRDTFADLTLCVRKVLLMKVSLLTLAPEKLKGKTIPVNVSLFIIGRDAKCHLRASSPSISKEHCALLTQGNKVFLQDCNSTNGTFLNGRQIKGEIELRHEDQIKIGTLEFAVHIEGAPTVNQATIVDHPSVPTGSTEMELAAFPPPPDQADPGKKEGAK